MTGDDFMEYSQNISGLQKTHISCSHWTVISHILLLRFFIFPRKMEWGWHLFHLIHIINCNPNTSVYGPFKKSVNITCNTWSRNNSGKITKSYGTPFILNEARIKDALDSEAEAGVNRRKRNTSFNGGRKKSRNSQQLTDGCPKRWAIWRERW
jgi:hypothetical protein